MAAARSLAVKVGVMAGYKAGRLASISCHTPWQTSATSTPKSPTTAASGRPASKRPSGSTTTKPKLSETLPTNNAAPNRALFATRCAATSTLKIEEPDTSSCIVEARWRFWHRKFPGVLNSSREVLPALRRADAS